MSKVVDKVVDSGRGVDNLKDAIAERIKKARSTLGVTQKELCAEIGMPLPSLRNYEAGKQIPGGEAILLFLNAGINGNWLLTGHGPMLLADLAPPAPEPVRINRGALAALLRGAIAITAQGMSVEAAADMAAEMYERALQNGEITPEGVGQGNLGNAA